MRKTQSKNRFIRKGAAVRQMFRQGLALVMVFLSCSWGYASAQGKKVSLEVKDAALREVLQEVKAQTGVKFVYSDIEIEKGKPVTEQFDELALQTALERILTGQPFAFEIENDIVIIKPAKQVQPAAPQTAKRTVSGVVKDEDGTPLPGVSVIVKGTQAGVATDINGRFEIRVDDNPEVALVFSFIGMKTKEVKIGRSQTLNVVLQSDTEALDEVVVTGVQTIEKGRATGSFSLLSQDDMKQIYSTSLSEKLEGAVPGLYVGKDNEITIRGISTLNANTKPLIVVDGFPMESSELNLNPNDIEQVTVLKDAASASIWGIRATNGVVVVTTKRGSKSNPLNVSYSGNVTYSGAVNLDDLHYLSADEFIRLDMENTIADYYTSSPYTGRTELQLLYGRYLEGEITEEQMYSELDELGSFSNKKQIEDNFYRHALTHQHNISLSCGGERSRTYASFSYDGNKSETVGNEYSKYNLLLNNDIDLRKNFTASLGIRATHQYSKRNGTDMTETKPWKRILNDDGSYYWEKGGIGEEYAEACEALGMKDWKKNALRDMRMNDKTTKSYNVSSSLKLAWKPIEGLELSTQGNYEFGNTHDVDWYSKDHYFTRDLVNQFAQVITDENEMPIGIEKYNVPSSGGIKDISNSHLYSYSVRNMISYSGNKGDFDYKAMIGNEFYSLEGNSYSDRLWGYDPELITSQSVNLKDLQNGVQGYDGTTYPQRLYWSPSTSETLERYTSYFGTASVSYKERYDLFGSVRLDQTNMLTNSNEFRNNPSWSVGAKWHLINESFFHSGIVDDLGIRASYGLTGNIDKTTGPDIVVSSERDTYDTGINYLQVTNPANPALGWEKTYTLNIGLNTVLWNGRLSLDADFYLKKSKDLLANVEIDPTVGWTSTYKNSAEVTNRGIDLTLYGRILNFPKVKWDATLQFSYNNNEVTSLSYTPTRSGAYNGSPVKGQPIGHIAVHRYGGLDERGEPTFLKAGDDTRYAWSTLNNLTIDDLRFMGRTTPPFFGSLSTNVKFHDFTFSVMATYRLGHKMRMPTPKPHMFGNFTEWYSEKYRWVEGQNNRDKWVPVHNAGSFVESTNRMNCLSRSDRLVDNAGIIRLKSISLEYDATRLLKKIQLKGGSVRVSGENLAYWTANKEHIDPDQVVTSSFDGTSLGLAIKPRMVISLNLNF